MRVKGLQLVQNEKKRLSTLLHMLGTIHHMIVIYGTQV